MNERVAPTLSSATERKPVTDLRQWLDILAGSDRLAVARPGVGLRFELAAIAKTLDAARPRSSRVPTGTQYR
jgi:2,5-furandicarboxylate decarboxylase 1